MKRSVFFGVCLGLALAVVVSAQAPSSGAAPRKKRVAVFDFDYATVHSGVAAIFGKDIDIGKGVTDLLVTYLVKDGTYSVIERKALDKIMAEQNFSNSDRANPTSAAKLGKLLGDVRPQRCRDLTARSPVEHRLRAAVEEPGCRLDAAQAFNDVVECVGEPSHPDCKPHKSERRQFAICALQ